MFGNLGYLALLIFICLLIAFLLGLLIGWLLRRGGVDQEEHNRVVSDLDACRKRRTALEGELKQRDERITALEAELADCRSSSGSSSAELASLRAALAAAEAERDAARSEADGLRADLDAAQSAGGSSALGLGSFAAGAAAANIVPDIDYAANPDDLKLLWGIGPKIEQLLNSAGIYTFRQVAAGSVEEFRKILNESGNPRLAQIANEESWSQQAELAREGEWDALKELQAKLNWRSGGQIS